MTSLSSSPALCAEPALKLRLAVPPSTNNLFVARRDGRGRAKTSAYKDWLNGVAWSVIGQVRLIDGAVRVLIEAPVSRRRDIDNLAKPTLDFLSKAGLIQDDRYVDDLRIVRVGEGDKMTVSVWPLP